MAKSLENTAKAMPGVIEPVPLPMQLRFDFSLVRLGGREGCCRGAIMKSIPGKIEEVWLRLRLQQEEAWVAAGIPHEVVLVAKRHAGNLRTLLRALQGDGADLAERHRKMRLQKPMRVIALEKEHGESVAACDLEMGFGQRWLRLTCCLRSDPLLRDLGLSGPSTLFEIMILAYERHVDLDPGRAAREVRFASLGGYDYALVFPVLPYPACELRVQDEDMGASFPVDVDLGAGSKFQENILDAQATLAYLFWQCFNARFPCKKKGLVSHTAHSWRGEERTSQKLKDCPSRQDALGLMCAVVKLHAFHVPMYQRVEVEVAHGSCGQTSFHDRESVSRLLEAIEWSFGQAAEELKASDVLPRAWSKRGRDPRPLKISPPFGWDDTSAVVTLVSPLLPISGELNLAVVLCKAVLHEEKEPSQLPLKAILLGFPAPGEESAAEASSEDEPDAHVHDQEIISVTVDLSRWAYGELTVLNISASDCWGLLGVLQITSQLEECIPDIQVPMRADFERDLSWLAYGLQALQRAHIKQGLRETGLVVQEMERPITMVTAKAIAREFSRSWGSRRICPNGGEEFDGEAQPGAKQVCPTEQTREAAGSSGSGRAWHARMGSFMDKLERQQRVMFVTGPIDVLHRRAEKLGYIATILPRQADGRYLGGFVRKQFDRDGPKEPLWLESRTRSYPYVPFFKAALPSLNPAMVLTPAEQKVVIRSFITDPPSKAHSPDGAMDVCQGGADLNPRSMLQNHVIEHFLPIGHHSAVGCMVPAQAPSCVRLLRGKWVPLLWLFHVETEQILIHFGPRMASHFCFMQTFAYWLIAPALLGIFAWYQRSPAHDTVEWKVVHPLLGMILPVWGSLVCVGWRRRLMKKAFFWQNGWLQLGAEFTTQEIGEDLEQVRPEFAAQYRKEMKIKLERTPVAKRSSVFKGVKDMLRVDAADATEGHGRVGAFSECSLRNDLEHFDAACFYPTLESMKRHSLSYFVTFVFLFLCCLATLANAYLADTLKNTTAGKFNAHSLAAMVSVMFITVLGNVERTVEQRMTDWQALREDRDYEGTLFMKLFLFSFFNTFNSLFFIALVRRDMEQLGVQVMFLSISLSLRGNLVEIGIPAAKDYIPKFCIWIRQCFGKSAQDEDEAEDPQLLSDAVDDVALRIVSDHLDREGTFSLIDEEIEIVLVHGMVIMFSLSFPLTPLITLAGMLLELRIDIFKLLKLQSWPEPSMQVGVGQTFQAFLFMTYVSVWFNGVLLYITEFADGKTAADLIMPDWVAEHQLLVVFLAEHVVFFIMFGFLRTSPVSVGLRLEQFRQSYYTSRVELTRVRAVQTSKGNSKILQRRVRLLPAPAQPREEPRTLS